MIRLPRWLHRFYAWARGCFWLPCPLCGDYFGGHEWRDRDGKSSTIHNPESAVAGNDLGICPACTRAGKGDQPPGVYLDLRTPPSPWRPE